MPDFDKKQALVVFTPSGKRGSFAIGTPVLTAARQLGVDIDSVCGGRAICGRCQIIPSVGEFAKHNIVSKVDHLSPPGANEKRYGEKRSLDPERRLSCSTRILGDVVIDVPPDSQVHKQVVRKRPELRDIELNPVTKLYYIEVVEPDMYNPKSDLERVYDALAGQWQLQNISCDMRILRELQAALRKGKWKVTIAIHNRGPEGTGTRQRIIAIWPGFHDKGYGLAVDIGSTTVAAHLCNLSTGEVAASAGMMNPQIRFGEDLMSRVSYVMMNPGGDVEMTNAIRTAVNTLAAQVAADAKIDMGDILEVVFVGNPVMHHLLLGIDPTELGGAPFALATGLAITRPASELGLNLHGGAHVYVLPCIAGHVGADAAAVILSETPYLSDEVTLVVDVGTNAEIILGNKKRLLAASSPTGPAFEGAQISSGQRAAAGAIDRVRIDPETLEPRFTVIGSDLWSNDEGFKEATKQIRVTGICGSGIIEVIAEMYLTGIISHDGVIDGAMAARSSRIKPKGRTFIYEINDASEEGGPVISITQNDVRAIQLAKAALYAGCKLLMEHFGVTQVDRITLAGAFGSHIDTKYAMVLGLIPDCDLEKVTSAGNAAGTGARIALLNSKARDEIEAVVRTIEKIETAVEPRFQEHFVDAMAFPHAKDPHPNLEKVLTLPPRKIVNAPAAGAGAGASGHKRRRRKPIR